MGLLQSIDETLVLCINEQQKEGANIYLKDIIKSLEKIRDIIYFKKEYTNEQRKKTAAGLHRIIVEDYSFANSELGIMLRKLADEFGKSK